jgi:hypothetical protein
MRNGMPEERDDPGRPLDLDRHDFGSIASHTRAIFLGTIASGRRSGLPFTGASTRAQQL